MCTFILILVLVGKFMLLGIRPQLSLKDKAFMMLVVLDTALLIVATRFRGVGRGLYHELQGRVDALERRVNARADELERRADELQRRVDEMEGRVDELQRRVEEVLPTLVDRNRIVATLFRDLGRDLQEVQGRVEEDLSTPADRSPTSHSPSEAQPSTLSDDTPAAKQTLGEPLEREATDNSPPGTNDSLELRSHLSDTADRPTPSIIKIHTIVRAGASTSTPGTAA